MRSLAAALGGRWTVTGDFAPGASQMPNGGPVSGVEVWRSGPGGFTFMQEEDLKTPFGEAYGVGFMWWDSDKGFRGLRCLNLNPQGCDVEASRSRISFKWDGKVLTIDFASSKEPSKVAFEEVFSDIANGAFTQTGYDGQADGSLRKSLVIHATRTGPAQ